MNKTKHLLFSYGTLQLESVQLKNYGRILEGKLEKLFGYKIEKLKISNLSVLEKSKQAYHPIAVKSRNEKDFIEGMLFEITDAELLETDKYEVIQYQRIMETFESGKQAWVYVAKVITP